MIEISWGQRLHDLRDAADLSLCELAKKVAISSPFLSDGELGRRFPSEGNFGKRATDLTVSDGFYLDELSAWVRRDCQLFTCYNVSRALRFSISGWCPKPSTRALPCPHPLSHQNQDRPQISGRRRLQTHLADLRLHRQRPT